MNADILLSIAGAFGGLELLKWLANLRNTRRKGAAEAADSVESIVAKRVKTYEESISFLQAQLQEKERQFADLSMKYQDSMQRGVELTRRVGELRLKYQSSRCDNRECDNRRPPFRWMKKTASGAAALLLLLAPGCTKKVYVPVETVRSSAETTGMATVRSDTVIRLDSVYLDARGDTIIKEVWRYRDKIRVRHDTLVVERVDSVRVPSTVVIREERESKSRPGSIASILWPAFGCLFVFYLILRKFKK